MNKKFTVFLFFFLIGAMGAQEMTLPFPEPDKIDEPIYENNIDTTATSSEPANEVPPETNIALKEPEKKSQIAPSIKKKKKDNKKKGKDKKENGDDAALHYQLGKMNLKAGQISQAEGEFVKAGNYPDALIERMLLKVKASQLEEAEKLVEEIADPEKQLQARLLLGNSLAMDKKNAQNALNQYYRIIAVDNPHVASALWGLSQLFYKMQDFKLALEYISRIILEQPDSEYLDDAFYLGGRIYETPGKFQNIENAVHFYRRFLSNMDKESFKASVYTTEVKRRLKKLQKD